MKRLFFTTALSALLVSSSAFADDRQASLITNYEDNAQATFSGRVSHLEDDEFVLNYEGQAVKVDFNEWDLGDDRDLRNYFTNGDYVIVSGEVDKDWFSDNELEADNIYFNKDYTYYYVTDVNPAYYAMINRYHAGEDGSEVSLRGEVVKVEDDIITLKTKTTEVRVDADDLIQDDNEAQTAALEVKKGDRIFVHGEIDDGFFEDKAIDADVVVKMNAMQKKS